MSTLTYLIQLSAWAVNRLCPLETTLHPILDFAPCMPGAHSRSGGRVGRDGQSSIAEQRRQRLSLLRPRTGNGSLGIEDSGFDPADPHGIFQGPIREPFP